MAAPEGATKEEHVASGLEQDANAGRPAEDATLAVSQTQVQGNEAAEGTEPKKRPARSSRRLVATK